MSVSCEGNLNEQGLYLRPHDQEHVSKVKKA